MTRGTLFGSAIGIALALAAPLEAEDFACPGGRITVQGGADRAPAICDMAARATERLASCGLDVAPGLTVELTRAMPRECYGIYHCHEDLIQLLPMEAYESYLTGHPDSIFGQLAPQVFFDSILRHEMAHAALDGMPCPYAACPATQEFVAYAMRIRFLSAADRAPIEARIAAATRESRADGVNAMILTMAPDLFVEHAYDHFTQQEDPCALVAAIVRGEVNFDMPF